MKKVSLPLIVLSIFLTACDSESNQKIVRNENLPKQEIIIQDFIGQSLPPNAVGVKYMPDSTEPQKIPNVNLQDPIVITKMPYKERP